MVYVHGNFFAAQTPYMHVYPVLDFFNQKVRYFTTFFFQIQIFQTCSPILIDNLYF